MLQRAMTFPFWLPNAHTVTLSWPNKWKNGTSVNFFPGIITFSSYSFFYRVFCGYRSEEFSCCYENSVNKWTLKFTLGVRSRHTSGYLSPAGCVCVLHTLPCRNRARPSNMTSSITAAIFGARKTPEALQRSCNCWDFSTSTNSFLCSERNLSSMLHFQSTEMFQSPSLIKHLKCSHPWHCPWVLQCSHLWHCPSTAYHEEPWRHLGKDRIESQIQPLHVADVGNFHAF